MVSFDSAILRTPPLVAADIIANCVKAHDLRWNGKYDEAEKCLSDCWEGAGTRPEVKGLSIREAAEVLLIAGQLTSLLGARRRLADAQERAQDLLTESQRLFELLEDRVKAGEAMSVLAHCYVKQGALDDAEVFLASAFRMLSPENVRPWADTIFRQLVVNERRDRPSESLKLLRDNIDTFHRIDRLPLYHFSVAHALSYIMHESDRRDEAEAALLHLEVARRWYKDNPHPVYNLAIENNAASIHCFLENYEASHACLKAAYKLADITGCDEYLICIRETHASLLNSEKRFSQAEDVIKINIDLLSNTEYKAYQCQSFMTYGNTLAGLQRFEESRTQLLSAIAAAEEVGDFAGARLAQVRLEEISNLEAVAERRSRTVNWRINSEAMIGAGMEKGKAYKFRLTGGQCKDGDIVAAYVTTATATHPVIAYIFKAAPNGVWLKWANQRYRARWFLAKAVSVVGVLITD